MDKEKDLHFIALKKMHTGVDCVCHFGVGVPCEFWDAGFLLFPSSIIGFSNK